MKIKSVLLALCLGFMALSCGPKDADIEKEILAKMGSMPEMTITVKDGIATISGTCKDDACKASCENIAKGVKGVKSVVNNCVVAPPPPPPVEISPDAVLTTSVMQVVQAYKGASASVSNGVVTLTGEIKRAELPMLMEAVQGLKPKKVENKLTIK
jgi:hyperosmotically inducible periplasmic protein